MIYIRYLYDSVTNNRPFHDSFRYALRPKTYYTQSPVLSIEVRDEIYVIPWGKLISHFIAVKNQYVTKLNRAI